MEYPDRTKFIDKSVKTLEGMLDMLENLPALKLDGLEPGRTALVIIDMINGFAREGALKSARVEALIPAIAELSGECGKRGIARVMFADNHTETSPEFKTYPAHCLKGTAESEPVDELKSPGGQKPPGGYCLIPKNSTNGFLEEDFAKWLKENGWIRNFIVTGDCTDICIQQFADTLKTWFNRLDEESRVIVPVNAVDTFDLGLHDGDFLNVVTLFSMAENGIELVSGINF